MHILYKNQYCRAKQPITHFKSNNSPLRILYSHTLVKERDRHQGTGVALGGCNSVWELTGEAFHLPQCTDSLVYFHLYEHPRCQIKSMLSFSFQVVTKIPMIVTRRVILVLQRCNGQKSIYRTRCLLSASSLLCMLFLLQSLGGSLANTEGCSHCPEACKWSLPHAKSTREKSLREKQMYRCSIVTNTNGFWEYDAFYCSLLNSFQCLPLQAPVSEINNHQNLIW